MLSLLSPGRIHGTNTEGSDALDKATGVQAKQRATVYGDVSGPPLIRIGRRPNHRILSLLEKYEQGCGHN